MTDYYKVMDTESKVVDRPNAVRPGVTAAVPVIDDRVLGPAVPQPLDLIRRQMPRIAEHMRMPPHHLARNAIDDVAKAGATAARSNCWFSGR